MGCMTRHTYDVLRMYPVDDGAYLFLRAGVVGDEAGGTCQ